MSMLRLTSLALLCLFTSHVAIAQERQTLKTVDQRLTRVENVLDQSLLKLLQRIDSLQKEVRVLSGEVESLQHELGKQQQRNRELQRNTDQRITQLEARQQAFEDDVNLELGLGEDFGGGQGGGAGGSLDETQGTGALDETRLPDVVVPAAGDGASNTPRFVSPDANQLVASNPNDPTAPRVPVRGNTNRAATQQEKSAYSNAYDLLARGDSNGAVNLFSDFLRQYPDGPFSDNAWYWQGEAFYASRAFDRARNNFGIVVNSFPQSAKVPDARLKIGYAMYEQGDYVSARQVLTSVQNDYPGRSASVLARKRLQKMNRENL